jgi:hypothetical protein
VAAHREVALFAAQPTSFVELRRAPAQRTTPELALGTWGRAEALAAQTELALSGWGLKVVREPLDLKARAVAGDDLSEGSTMVSLLVPRLTLQSEAWRSPARALQLWSWVEQRDAEPIDVVREMLRDWAAPPSDASQLFRSAERATVEQSAVARSQLRELLAGGAGRARIARANGGVFLEVVSRTAQGFRIGSFPIASIAPVGELLRAEAGELVACAPLLTRGGICTLSGSR